MRIAFLLLTMSAGLTFAQQASSPCQAPEDAVARMKLLREKGVVSQQQFDETQAAYAQCQARQAELKASRQAEMARMEAQLRENQAAKEQQRAKQAELSALNAQEISLQANLDALRTRLSDSHPDVKALKTELESLRSQEAALAQTMKRPAREVPSLRQATKQTAGGLQLGLPDRWWKNPGTVQSLGLTSDQQKKMDETFQQYRLRLIDLNAALEKEEVVLEPLVAAPTVDEAKIAAQIDRVAQARAELEKANGRMLLGIRKQLTPEQWSKVNQLSPAQK